MNALSPKRASKMESLVNNMESLVEDTEGAQRGLMGNSRSPNRANATVLVETVEEEERVEEKTGN
jgi:hypothetical protein